MVGDIFSLVASGAVLLSGLIFMAAVIGGSRSEDNIREWEENGGFYRNIRDGSSSRMSVARVRSSPGFRNNPAIARKAEPRNTRPGI
jgi:hypothetical protein